MDNSNPLLEAYVNEKERESEKSTLALAHALRMHYVAFIKEGFSEDDALALVDTMLAEIISSGLGK